MTGVGEGVGVGVGVAIGEGLGVGHGVGVMAGVGVGKAVGVGDGLGVGSGVDVNVGVGVDEGEGTGVGSGVGVGEEDGEGVGVGVGSGSGISSVSPSEPSLALFNKERGDCVIAGLITLTKHIVITTKVPIPRQLHFPFISSSPVHSLIAGISYSHQDIATPAIQYQLQNADAVRCDFNPNPAPLRIHSPEYTSPRHPV
ncbi:hypothetical protein ES705_03240 [subsurface metagenome]